MAQTFISQLEWRHATKAFDNTKPVSDADLQKVLKAIILAPTSYGLQPFRVHVLDDASIKQKVFELGWKQKQYATASAILVFTVLTDLKTRITEYMDIATGGDTARKESLKGYERAMRGALERLPQEEVKSWGARQAYIALGFAMAACAELGIDSCPMEGFSPPDLDKLMDLPPGEFSCVMLTIGYRDPGIPVKPKVRFPSQKLVVRLKK